jgi:hypothetical protein
MESPLNTSLLNQLEMGRRSMLTVTVSLPKAMSADLSVIYLLEQKHPRSAFILRMESSAAMIAN